ncbi:MAG TPA: DNA-binding protein [Nitrospirota bacterium]|nr:DNA-binding protein [Nitrospirota bacterium]
MKRLIFLLVAGFLSITVSGAYAASENEKAAPGPQVPTIERTADTVGPSLSGKVVETMNSGGYTYVRLEKNGKKTWIAVPEMKVSVGQQMAFQPGMEMKNFTSNTLNRTFERIIFSGGPAVSQKGTGDKTAAVKAPGSKAAVVVSNEKFAEEKAAGPDAYTVGEIYAKRASLDKKTAVVRGKVVKVSKGIMGKNWIHIQDGTGESGKGTQDLVVTTTMDTAAVGDAVTVKGTIYKDKDFGAGYKYDVIMEEATIQH